MVRWHNQHRANQKLNMVRHSRILMQSSSDALNSHLSSSSTSSSSNSSSSSSSSTNSNHQHEFNNHSDRITMTAGDEIFQPFTHFDVSSDLDIDEPLSANASVPPSSSIPTSPPASPSLSPSSCQIQKFRTRNPLCLNMKSTRELFPRLGSISPPYLLLESLIYLMCQIQGQDDEQTHELFEEVCTRLESMGFIGSSYRLDPSHQMHKTFGSSFSRMIYEFRREKYPSICDAKLFSRTFRLLNQAKICDFIEQSRYSRSFGKKTLISRGGFGTVYRARHLLDEVDYAVKTIQFRVRTSSDYVKILREVQLYANLPSHPNVVAYKTAWLESDFTDSGPQNSSKVVIQEIQEREVKIGEDEELTIKTTSNSNSGSIVFEDNSASPRIESVPDSPVTMVPKQEQHESLFEMTGDRRMADSKSHKGSIGDVSGCLRIQEISNSLSGTTGSINSHSTLDSGPLGHHNRRRVAEPEIEFPASPTDDVPPNARVNEKISVTLYVQMELCGINLKTWISRRNKKVFNRQSCMEHEFDPIFETTDGTDEMLTRDEYKFCLKIFKQILKGVSFLHSHHLIHRDLKPQNILFDLNEENVKIGDFGLATLHDDNVHVQHHSPMKNGMISVSGHTIGMGTSLYVAPEQRITSRYDVRADMYSLGIILFELLCPFNTMMEKEKCITSLKAQSILPHHFVNKFPAAAKIILQLICLNPTDRPSAARVLESDLFPSKDQIISDLESQLQRMRDENIRLRKLLKQERICL